jgi:hypothetical protein
MRRGKRESWAKRCRLTAKETIGTQKGTLGHEIREKNKAASSTKAGKWSTDAIPGNQCWAATEDQHHRSSMWPHYFNRPRMSRMSFRPRMSRVPRHSRRLPRAYWYRDAPDGAMQTAAAQGDAAPRAFTPQRVTACHQPRAGGGRRTGSFASRQTDRLASLRATGHPRRQRASETKWHCSEAQAAVTSDTPPAVRPPTNASLAVHQRQQRIRHERHARLDARHRAGLLVAGRRERKARRRLLHGLRRARRCSASAKTRSERQRRARRPTERRLRLTGYPNATWSCVRTQGTRTSSLPFQKGCVPF